ncbi:MAG: protein translocase subunit SecF [bacterium]
MIDLVGKRNWFYALSGILLVIGLIALWRYDLRLSIDFQGGSMIELKTEKEVNSAAVYKIMEDLGYKDSIVQVSGTNNVVIRSKSKTYDPQKEDEKAKKVKADATATAAANAAATANPSTTAILTPASTKSPSIAATTPTNNKDTATTTAVDFENPAALTAKEQEDILAKITDQFGKTEKVQLQSIGPTIGKELTQKTIWAVIIAALFIILYMAYAFRAVPAPASGWRFGVVAVIALIHDLIFVLGMTAVLGHFIGLEIDALFVVALLNIMSFSVHDSIVSLDRTRENLTRMAGQPFEKIVNQSLLQTIVRSLNINLAVLFTLFALYFFGAESIKHFILILIIGIIVGTYSSIFNASPLLVTWHNWSLRRKAKEQEEA